MKVFDMGKNLKRRQFLKIAAAAPLLPQLPEPEQLDVMGVPFRLFPHQVDEIALIEKSRQHGFNHICLRVLIAKAEGREP